MAFEDLIAKIEAQERWLGGLEVEAAPPDGLLERTKQRVRVAVDEAWLAERGVTEPPPRVLSAVKRAVAQVLASVEPARPSWGGLDLRQVYARSRSMAAAAAVVFAAGLGFWSAISTPDRTAPADELADLVAVLSREPDDEEAEWNTIEAELVALESALARTTPSWDRFLLDDLDDDTNFLLDDMDGWLGEATDAS